MTDELAPLIESLESERGSERIDELVERLESERGSERIDELVERLDESSRSQAEIDDLVRESERNDDGLQIIPKSVE